ncbi:MAG: response regulator [Ignavibacteria bacterium]|nr:response regulator [Ignavibacteria bacterium]
MTEIPVLIIDDDIWMQRILSKIISSFGFIPYVASSGYDGIALAVEHKPALIMLDVLMPDLTGQQTLKVLKHIQVTKEIPIVMVTAISDIENIGLAIKAGAAGFVGKPFTRATIYDKIRDVVNKDIISQASLKSQSNDFVADTKPAAAESRTYIPTESDANIYDSATKSNAMPQQILPKTYKEEDKKNIEAIKELLLKPRR